MAGEREARRFSTGRRVGDLAVNGVLSEVTPSIVVLCTRRFVRTFMRACIVVLCMYTRRSCASGIGVVYVCLVLCMYVCFLFCIVLAFYVRVITGDVHRNKKIKALGKSIRNYDVLKCLIL